MSGYVLTEQAEQDLTDIWDHIAPQSIDSANAVVREIRDAFELLARMPGIGYQRRDVKNPRYRFWRANRFIIDISATPSHFRSFVSSAGTETFEKSFRPEIV